MSSIMVKTGSRIHITLIDMNGSETGRVDGGVGLMLRDPQIEVHVEPARVTSVRISSPDVDNKELQDSVRALLTRIKEHFRTGDFKAEIISCPALHAGFGAKSQVLQAIATAALRCYECEIDPAIVTKLSERGGTSGVGVHGFWHGGFIVDAGHQVAAKGINSPYRPSSRSVTAGAATFLARYDFPDWPILLILPKGYSIHGEWEARLFDEVCPVPMDDVRAVSHSILMHMIPAIVENDIQAFGDSLWNIQDRRWKAFEIQAQDPGIGKIMHRLRYELGVTGAGMSSWGTSIMCVDERLEGDSRAAFLSEVRRMLDSEANSGSILVTSALNTPALISSCE